MFDNAINGKNTNVIKAMIKNIPNTISLKCMIHSKNDGAFKLMVDSNDIEGARLLCRIDPKYNWKCQHKVKMSCFFQS
jgi:hypothetical protein